MPSKQELHLIIEETEQELARKESELASALAGRDKAQARIQKQEEERTELLWSLGLVEVSRLKAHAIQATVDYSSPPSYSSYRDIGGAFVGGTQPNVRTTFEFDGDLEFFARLARAVTSRA